MKKLLIAIFGVILFTTQGIASEMVRITEYVDEHDKRTAYVTTFDVLKKCPEWTLDKEPPLPINKAVDIAAQWAKKKYPQIQNQTVVSISLSEIWNEKFKNRWYYTVSFNAGADLDGINANAFFNVIVLMDGTVVGPTTSKSEER